MSVTGELRERCSDRDRACIGMSLLKEWNRMVCKRLKKQLSILLLAALTLTACGAGSEAKIEGPSGGSYRMPEPITAVDHVGEEVKTSKAPDETDTPTASAETDTPATPAAAAGASYKVSFAADNKWQGGFQGTIKIKNTGKKTIKDWKLVFTYDVEFESSWNGNVKNKGNEYTITGVDFNRYIKGGETAEIGFIGKGDFKPFPATYEFTYT